MTTKEYILNLSKLYPNTFIGIKAFYASKFGDILKCDNIPLDYMLSILVLYIEHRNVNFLEALCNTHIDNVADSHSQLRLKTVTHILKRLEKYEVPAEGRAF